MPPPQVGPVTKRPRIDASAPKVDEPSASIYVRESTALARAAADVGRRAKVIDGWAEILEQIGDAAPLYRHMV